MVAPFSLTNIKLLSNIFLQKSYIDDEDIFFSFFFNIFALDDSAQYLELDNSAHHWRKDFSSV